MSGVGFRHVSQANHFLDSCTCFGRKDDVAAVDLWQVVQQGARGRLAPNLDCLRTTYCWYSLESVVRDVGGETPRLLVATCS